MRFCQTWKRDIYDRGGMDAVNNGRIHGGLFSFGGGRGNKDNKPKTVTPKPFFKKFYWKNWFFPNFKTIKPKIIKKLCEIKNQINILFSFIINSMSFFLSSNESDFALKALKQGLPNRWS